MSRTRLLAIAARSLVEWPPTGDRGDDRHLVLGLELHVQPPAEADVLVVQVDVHELAQVARGVEDALAKAGEAALELLDRTPQVARLHLDCRLALGQGPQRAGDSHSCHRLDI